jgi:hypothetical protein
MLNIKIQNQVILFKGNHRLCRFSFQTQIHQAIVSYLILMLTKIANKPYTYKLL